jgi:hypothetical protein
MVIVITALGRSLLISTNCSTELQDNERSIYDGSSERQCPSTNVWAPREIRILSAVNGGV